MESTANALPIVRKEIAATKKKKAVERSSIDPVSYTHLLLLAMLALACFNIWRKVRRKTRNQY